MTPLFHWLATELVRRSKQQNSILTPDTLELSSDIEAGGEISIQIDVTLTNRRRSM